MSAALALSIYFVFMKCKFCKKNEYMRRTWKYCPNCGKPLPDISQKESTKE